MVNQLVAVLTGNEVIALMGLGVGNVVLSMIVALVKGVFTFDEFPRFILTRVAPLIAYIFVAVFAAFSFEWEPVRIAVLVGLIALYTKGILAAVRSLTGLPIPDILTEPVATILAKKE